MNIPGPGRAPCVLLLMDTVRSTPASQTPQLSHPQDPSLLLSICWDSPLQVVPNPTHPTVDGGQCGRRSSGIVETHTEASPGFQREDEAAIPHHSLISGLGKAHLRESREGQLKEDPRREEEKGDAGVNLPCLHPQWISTSCSAFNSCHL